MKINKNILWAFLAMGICSYQQEIYAQVDPDAYGYYQDALRYSQTTFGGTARFMGIAGASTAVGGEITNAFSNPAGLGGIRYSEFVITPGFNNANSTSDYSLINVPDSLKNGIRFSPTSEFKMTPTLNQLGVVFALPSFNSKNKYKGGSFAISFTRLNNFNSKVAYEGTNPDNSIIDYFYETTNGTPWSQMDNQVQSGYMADLGGLAYFTYILNKQKNDPTQSQYYSFIPVTKTKQYEVIERSGSQNQWNFSYGGNYDNKLYFGLSFGIQSLNFAQKKVYEETPTENSPLISLTLEEKLEQTGGGINGSLGLIYRPVYNFRVGVNIISPTYLSIKETYNARLDANYNNYQYDDNGNIITLNTTSGSLAPAETSFQILTPMRLNTGAAFFIGKGGFISADIEYVDYKSAKITAEFRTTADNNTIKNVYKSALNFRLGGEARIDIFRLRAGVAYYGSPHAEKNDTNKNSNLMLIGGVGVKTKRFHIDLATSFANAKSDYMPYTLIDNRQPLVSSKNKYTNITLTGGISF